MNDTNLYDLSADIVMRVRWWFLLFLFVAFLVVTSDVFVERVVGNFEGALEVGHLTTWGCIVQGSLFVSAAALYEFLLEDG